MDDGTQWLSLLASGREADVYLCGDHAVLRRYRDGSSPADEVALMRYVGSHGYPVPTVHAIRGVDLIMELVEGPTMTEALQSGEWEVPAAARQLARLHDHLHALPTPAGTPADQRLLHLDLHPSNVIMSGRGPVVIDWRYGRSGPVDLDVALTAVILAEGAVGSPAPRQELFTSFLVAFVAMVQGDATALLDQAVERRTIDFPGPQHRQRQDLAAQLVLRVCGRTR